jgi:hypothetical protein
MGCPKKTPKRVIDGRKKPESGRKSKADGKL